MSGCAKCKGAGQVRDLSWCGDAACCPEFLACLACQPPVFTDFVYPYDPKPAGFDYPELSEGDVVQVRDRETGEVVGHATVGPRVEDEPTVFEIKFGPQP